MSTSVAVPHHGVPSAEEADARIALAAGLGGTEVLLSSARLSEALGRPVTVNRVRLKPGRSVVVAFTEDGTTGPAPSPANPAAGWAAVIAAPEKLGKATQRAAEAGEELTVVGSAPPWLISASAYADPPLAKELAEVREALGTARPWRILRYNPRRRLVVALGGDRPDVVRVHAGDAEAVLATASRWRSLGLPVTGIRPLGGRGTATIAPLWGCTDLLARPHAPAARTAGEAIGRLHRATVVPPSPDPRERPGTRADADLTVTLEAVRLIAPWLGERAAALAGGVTEHLRTAEARQAELHGDLSPDQVVLADPSSHKIRLIDFDRAGSGDPMRDLGSWIAACRHAGIDQLIEPFLAGYGEYAEVHHEDLRAWQAYAHLRAALDPFRRREAHWPASVSRAVALAEGAMR